MRHYYAASYAYGRVAANHGLRADTLYASTNAAKLAGLDRLSRRDAEGMFGSRAVAEARQHGSVKTHICNGSC